VKIVRYFAPKGYHAVADKSKCGCVGCAFENDAQCGLTRKCTSSERPDGRTVIFIANDKANGRETAKESGRRAEEAT
jgi:hypothetical protein